MPTRTVGKYKLTRQLGIGMFSKVMLGVDERTGEQFAVKIMRKDHLEEMSMALYARREAAVLRRLKHINVVSLVEAIQSEKKLFLVMERVPGQELLDVVAAGPLREGVARRYMKQLVDAVTYFHRKGVCHRDLKPENVLIDQVTGNLKIIDFGLTGVLKKNALMRTSCGSTVYSAPEVTYAAGRGYDGVKADAWSLGLLCYIMLTASHPFVDRDGNLMVAALKEADVEYPSDVSRPAMHFISRLLTLDPARRYSPAQALLHPWITGKPMAKRPNPQSPIPQNHALNELQRPQRQRAPFSRGPIPRERRFFHGSSPKPFALFSRYTNPQNGTANSKTQSAGSFPRFWKDREKHRDERQGSISSSFRWFRRHRGITQDERVQNRPTMARSASYRTDGKKSPRKFRSHSLSSALRRSSSRDSGFSAR